MKLNRLGGEKGSILILCLWVLAILSIFTVHIGMRIRQRASLLRRMEERNQLRYLSEAGIKKAIAALKNDYRRHNKRLTSYGKFYRYNNIDMFAKIPLGSGTYEVFYTFYDGRPLQLKRRFGFMEEESKLNVNAADPREVKRLIRMIAIADDDQAQELADAIIDWRAFGRGQVVGFYSDQYYANLQEPYDTKDAPFENIDELLLVKGMTPALFKRLSVYMTVYGDGRININTASKEVILSLGVKESVADKIIEVRRGKDQLEATQDDYIFYKTFDIASEILNFVSLEVDEVRQIDAINAMGKIKTASRYYSLNSLGTINTTKDTLQVACVYNADENQVIYWREKY